MRRSVQILACLLLALGWQPVASWGQTFDAANAFVTRWQGEAGKDIQVPLYGNYAYRWEKADGTEVKAGVATVANGGLLELPVGEDGEYVLKAGPAGVKRIEFGVFKEEQYNDSRGTPGALLRVEQWGKVKWESFAGAFYGCGNMRIADDAGKPDLSGVESMHSAFEGCSSFNSPIGPWDVSGVTNMMGMFYECSAFNQPLGGWDVSKVTNMSAMFASCESFNQPLEGWDVSNVTSMWGMFEGCSSFNQPLEGWDVSRVTNMWGMFEGCSSFNQPLGAWDVSKVTDMSYMLSGCIAFNQPLAKWDVSKVTDMSYMLSGCIAFNQPLEQWDVSKVTNMEGMFAGSSSFNQPLGGWTLSALARDEERDHDLGLGVSGLDATNYSSTLEAWAAKRDKLKVGVRVKADRLKYDAAGKSARQQLTDGRGWEFAGDGEATVASPAVEIVGAPTWLAVGATHAFTARVVPAEAPQAVTWSVEGGGAAFTDNVLKVTKEGIITVTATSEAVATSKRSVKIRVIVPVALTGITVSPASVQLGVSETQALTVGYTPADATNRTVSWSSDNESVATVDAAGVVTPKGKGTAKITATAEDGGYKASCAVTVVVPVALTDITVSPTTARLVIGGTQALTVGYAPEDAANKAVTWSSSNESVATVSEEGVVTAKGKGSATITATAADGGHTATCAVEVPAPVVLTGITVSPTSKQLPMGATLQLTVKYTPADATNKAVTWSSSDEEVATVSAQGKVTAKGKGSATITATSADGGHTATCAVEVTAPVALTGITVSPVSARLKAGETQQLTVGYAPEDATNKSVTWNSSDERVATVDAAGQVTAKGEGSATITAVSVDGGHTATCAVEVTSVTLTGITVSPTSAQLKAGETQPLTVGYTPADATNRAVTWSSSDAGVATVDAQGKVAGVKAGSATITATAADGGHKASCEVTVEAADTPSGVESVALAGVSVSPNPFGDHLTVRGAEGVLRYSLVSATGAVMLEGAHAGGDELRLSTSHLPAGIYWLRLVAEDGERVVQVVRR